MAEVDLVAVVLGDQIERVVQGGEHAQTEEVEFHQARGSAVVLVPLQHRPVGHPRPFHRTHLRDRGPRQDHAARMNPQMPRMIHKLLGKPPHILGDHLRLTVRAAIGVAVAGFRIRAGVAGHVVLAQDAGEGVLLTGGVAKRFRRVPDRRAEAVGDHVRHLRRVRTPIVLVHVLNHLLTPP